MNASNVLEPLGFSSDNPHWIPSERLNGIADALRRALQSEMQKEPQIQICGSYVIQSSSADEQGKTLLPPRPAVHVVEVGDENQAQLVRKKLWNLGTAPFLILILPSKVLVYNGFNYEETDKSADDFICQSPLTVEEISDILRDFQAHSIDSGRIWKHRFGNLTPEKRVDQKLLVNLKELGEELKHRFQLQPNIAHALIGKFIYLWYLRERSILSDQWLSQKGLASWEELTGRDTSAEALRELVGALEIRFEGHVFPLDFADLGARADEIVRFVAGIFRGDKASGQLALNFRIYDFSCIPVELLSSIYEQFLKDEGRGKKEGAVYTLEFIADYVLCEINSFKPLQAGMKILDPACGSGVFLVLAYQRLIERRLQEKQVEKLEPQELKQILEESIYGAELIDEACYVAQFSLILMLLSYVDPPELHANDDFRFPELYNRNIFQGDFFDSQLALVKSENKFDWIVGNPSWESVTEKEQPLAHEWINENKQLRPVGGNNLCEAFTWRVGDFLADGGCVGLLTKATSLTNETSDKYRRAFFGAHEVCRVTNFANLAYILFAGRADLPAASLIYRKAEENQTKHPIVHYGPFAANQTLIASKRKRKKNQAAWSITIHQDEITQVAPDVAASGEGVVWKRALWANYRDEKALKSLGRLFPSSIGETLGVENRDWKLHEGVPIRNIEDVDQDKRDLIEYCSELGEIDFLDVNQTQGEFRLIVPEHLLSQLPEEKHYFRKQGGKKGLEVANAPHIYWSVTTAAYSDLDFVLPSPQKALSAPKEDADRLRATSAYLNSSAGRYLTFFNLIRWGIDRNEYAVSEVNDIPLPNFTEEQVAQLCNIHRGLSESQSYQYSLFAEDSSAGKRKKIQKIETQIRAELDIAVERILNVPDYLGIIARDFMNVRYQLNKGDITSVASESADLEELRLYANYLREILDEFARGKAHHRIGIVQNETFTVCTVEITRQDQPIAPKVREQNANDAEDNLWENLEQQFSQWVYVQRSLQIFDGSKIHFWKTSRLMDWTRTQALIDSDTIIAEVLNAREVKQ